MITCSIEGCSRPHKAHGLCPSHNYRRQRYGDPEAGRPVPSVKHATVEQRFWAKVNKDGPAPEYRPTLGPCWIWTAASALGYGQIRISGKIVLAHRWSYEATYGPIPAGKQLDHLCREPSCVNPSHLEAVSPRVNVARGTSPAARHAIATHCPKRHEYSEANTYVSKNGKRFCRQCSREQSAKYFSANREAVYARRNKAS